MLKRLAALTAIALVALAGTAHAAQYSATQLTAILDKAEKAAGAGFVALPNSSAPAPFKAVTPEAQAAGVKAGTVGSGTRYLNGAGHLWAAFAAQSSTPAKANTGFKDVEHAATSVKYPDATETPVGFKTQKIQGQPVTFYDQSIPATVNGVPQTQTSAWASVVDGRTLVHFAVDNPDAATARANVRTWVTAYLASSAKQ
jgi:hypothetical protein